MNRKEVYKLIEDHYREHYEGLIKQYRARTQSTHMAEDIVQEGYANACQYWETYEPGNFDGWIKIIIYNASKGIVNEERARGMIMKNRPAPEPVMDGPVEARDELRSIDEKINDKPGVVQRLLRLALIEQWTQEEVAAELGVTQPYIAQTVKEFRASL